MFSRIKSLLGMRSSTTRQADLRTNRRLSVEVLEQRMLLAGDLVTHYDGSSISGASEGAAVVQWNDVSGNNNHAVQSAAAAQVGTYVSSGIGGLPSIAFDGAFDPGEGGYAGDGYQSLFDMGTSFGIHGNSGWAMTMVVRNGGPPPPFNVDHIMSLGKGSIPNGLAAVEISTHESTDPADSRLDIAGGWGNDVVLNPDGSFYPFIGEDLILTVTHTDATQRR